MSTRAQFSFEVDGERNALIYKHCDGYPDSEHGALAVLKRFFEQVEKECKGDLRYDDPVYLAAKFVIYLVKYEGGHDNLNFLGVGISMKEHGDIEYLYHIDCSDFDENHRPIITYNKPYES